PATGETSNPLLFLSGLSLVLTATFLLKSKKDESDIKPLANSSEQVLSSPDLVQSASDSPKEQLPATGETSNPLLFLSGLSLVLTATFLLKSKKDES
ncbi:LPXTG cell wall anchor domain-containing protein, partial [Mycobacterium tuberculosis]|nr:LPXTG cell wall anchor domain-containing protein [Mycobacterium tuberculosis]